MDAVGGGDRYRQTLPDKSDLDEVTMNLLDHVWDMLGREPIEIEKMPSIFSTSYRECKRTIKALEKEGVAVVIGPYLCVSRRASQAVATLQKSDGGRTRPEWPRYGYVLCGMDALKSGDTTRIRRSYASAI